MSKILEILANKDLGDDQEIKIGEETYNLGDLRAVNTERETYLKERDTLARERDDFRGKYETQSSTLTELLGEANRRAEAEGKEPPPKSAKDTLREVLGPLLESDDGTKALFEDKVFGKALSTVEERAYQRAKKEFEALEGKFTELGESVKKGFEGMTVAQLNERAERWYDVNRSEIPKGENNKKMPLLEIHKYAMEHNLVKPGTRLIDYDAALEQLTAPQRLEESMSAAEKRGYEKGLQAAREAAGKVIPIFGDRSAGATPGDKISTVGKSAKQIVSENLARGLAEISAAENE